MRDLTEQRRFMKMTLSLKGLKITWIGFLLSLIGSVVSGIGTPRSNGAVVATTSAGTVIGVLISIVAVILIIVGLSMVKDISDHYRKARNYQIIQLIIAIIFVALVMGVVAASLSNGREPGTGFIALCIVMVVILAVFAILFYRHLLQGCDATAVYAGDDNLAEKCRKLWKLYIVGFIIAIAGVIVLFIGLGAAINRIIPSMTSALMATSAMIRSMAPGMIIVGVGAVIMLVFSILLLIRMAKICSFDGKTIENSATKDNVDVENI